MDEAIARVGSQRQKKVIAFFSYSANHMNPCGEDSEFVNAKQCVYICVYVCMYVCVCVCIYIYIYIVT
jgi:hypothetical protein